MVLLGNRNRQAIFESQAFKLCEHRQNMASSGLGYRKGRPLLELLRIYHGAGCTEIRDKLFGLYGFTESCCRDSVPADYSRSIKDLCNDVLVHHFTSKHVEPGSLNMIHSVEILHKLVLENEAKRIFSEGELKSVKLRYEEVSKGLLRAFRFENLGANFPTLDVTGFDNGTIDFIIPSLRKVDGISHSLRVPRQLLERANKNLRETKNGAFEEKMERETDHTSQTRDGNTDNVVPSKSPPQYSAESSVNSEYWKASDNCKDLLLVPKDHKLSRLISLVRFYLRTQCTSLQDCSLFFGMDGMLGLAPTSIRISDVICSFKKSDNVAIVRINSQGYHGYQKYTVIGQAVWLLPTELSTNMRPTINLQLDRPTLETLTKCRQ